MDFRHVVELRISLNTQNENVTKYFWVGFGYKAKPWEQKACSFAIFFSPGFVRVRERNILNSVCFRERNVSIDSKTGFRPHPSNPGHLSSEDKGHLKPLLSETSLSEWEQECLKSPLNPMLYTISFTWQCLLSENQALEIWNRKEQLVSITWRKLANKEKMNFSRSKLWNRRFSLSQA